MLVNISQAGDQVFLNTHSPVLIADDDSDQNIYKVLKTDKTTDVTKIEGIEKQYVVYEMLGGSPSDLLFPSNFIVVEGQTEFHFINEMIKRFYPEYSNLVVIHSGGDIERQEVTMSKIFDVYKTIYATPIYKDKVILLCDKPNSTKEDDYNRFISDFSLQEDNDVFTLPTETIEEYYPNGYKKNKGEVDWKEKVTYAKEVANNISKVEFESLMSKVFLALKKAYEKSYKGE